MKKKILCTLMMVTMVMVNGCGSTNEMQAQYDNKSNESPNTSTVSQQSTTSHETDTSGEVPEITGNFSIGESATIGYNLETDEYSIVDVTITGYEAAYSDVEGRTITLIPYTVTGKEGAEMSFGNDAFVVYADNQYVESTSYGEYTFMDFGYVRPGMSYSGVYVADVDPNVVSSMQISCGPATWILKDGEVYEEETFDILDLVPASGYYGDETNGVSISIYSSQDTDAVGIVTAYIEEIGEVSGEVYYDDVYKSLYTSIDDPVSITVWFSPEGGYDQITVDVQDGEKEFFDWLEVTERYES